MAVTFWVSGWKTARSFDGQSITSGVQPAGVELGERMNRSNLLLGGVVATLLAGTAVAEEYRARLGRVAVDTRTQSTVAGLGHATADLDGNRLTIAGAYAGLLGPATEANLHLGLATGARGPVIHSLTVERSSEGDLEGNVRLNAEQVAALKAGRLYIQLHSEAAPDGNLWGWLLASE